MKEPVNHYRVDVGALEPIVAYLRQQPYETVVGLLNGLQAGTKAIHHDPIDPEPEPPTDPDEIGGPEDPTA